MLSAGSPTPYFEHKPVFGYPIDSRVVATRRPFALVFLGAVTNPAILTTLADLTSVWPELDEKGIGLCGVVQGRLIDVRDFVPRHHVLFPILHDTDGSLTARFELPAPKQTESRLRAWPRSVLRGLRQVRYTGTFHRIANAQHAQAAFVLGPQNKLIWSWYGQGPADALNPRPMVDAALSVQEQPTDLSE